MATESTYIVPTGDTSKQLDGTGKINRNATAPSTTPPAPTGTTALTSSTLAPQQSIQPVESKPSTAAAGFSAQMTMQAKSGLQEWQDTLGREEDQIMALLKAPGETALKAQAYQDEGVDAANKQRKYYNQKMIESQEAQRAELEALGKNGALTPAQMRAQTDAINRKYISEQADIAINKLAADGDYFGAKEIADRAVTAMLEQRRNDLEARMFTFENHKDLFDKYEQRLYLQMEGDRQRALDQEEYQWKAKFDQKIDQENMRLQGSITRSNAAYAHSLANQPMPGENPQLYSGLNSATATAVRAKVNDYTSDPVVKNFAVIKEGRNFAGSLSDKTTNPSDDQGLIYALAKALDPGSVVREGEYATAQKYSQSLIDAYGKGITQAINGTGFLSEQARRNIKDTIEARYQASLGSYKGIQSQYEQNINSLTGRTNGSQFLPDYNVSAQAAPAQTDLPTLASQKGIPSNELQEAIAQYGEEAVRKFLSQ